MAKKRRSKASPILIGILSGILVIGAVCGTVAAIEAVQSKQEKSEDKVDEKETAKLITISEE